MSIQAIISVDATANTLEVTAHGKVTGDGPVHVRGLSGSVVPGSLSELTAYWVIKADDDNVKLATSSANALLGTAVDLSDVGSGVLYLDSGIPCAHATTYAQGSQVKSADLNAMQTALRDWHRYINGQPQSTWTPTQLDPETKTIFPQPNKATNWAFDGDVTADPGGLEAGLLSSGAGDAYFCLSDHMRRGQRLTSVRLWLVGDASVDVTATVFRHDFDASEVTSEGFTTEVDVPAALTFLDIEDLDIDYSFDQLTRIWLFVNADAAGARLLAIILGFSPPE